MNAESGGPKLRLAAISGPPVQPFEIAPTDEAIIGRGNEASVFLADPTISRLHASVVCRNRRWLLIDRGSRHGTSLNDVRLTPGIQTPLADGDLLRLGPWVLRVGIGASAESWSTSGTLLATVDDTADSSSRVRTAPERTLPMPEHQLRLLLEFAASLAGIPDEPAAAGITVRVAREGSGFARAALLRLTGGDAVDLIALDPPLDPSEGTEAPRFSRTLVRAASEGRTAELTASAEPDIRAAHSIAELGITAAMCIPVAARDSVGSLLYLDQAGGREIAAGAHGFCTAVARLHALCVMNLRRADLERRSSRIEAELSAARGAQQMLMPESGGRRGRVRWAVGAQPGRFVAGDLFDVLPLPDGSVAVVIGDVTGEGVEAGVLMAATQSHLHALLAHHDLADAVGQVNRYLSHRSSANRFVTLWVGVISADGSIRAIDAGHGHCVRRQADGTLERITLRGGIPIGIDPSFNYVAETCSIQPGERLILYTDGLVEQTDAHGEEFGLERVARVLRSTATPDEDLSAVLLALRQFSGDVPWTDDVTVASIALESA